MRYNLYVKEIKGYELYKEFRNNIPDIADENKLKHKENKDVSYTDITYAEFQKEVVEFGTGLMSLGYKDKRISKKPL